MNLEHMDLEFDTHLDGVTEGRPTRCRVVRPRVPEVSALPYVIVIHDIFGASPHWDDIGERFARAGYCAILPDLYGRLSVPSLSRERLSAARRFYASLVTDASWADGPKRDSALGSLQPDARDDIIETFRAMGLRSFTGDARRDDSGHSSAVARIVEVLTSEGASVTGAVGFCFGGTVALGAAVRSRAIQRTVMFYARPPSDYAMERLNGPVLAFYGNTDTEVTRTAGEFLAKSEGSVHSVRTIIYEAGHAFFDDTGGHYAAAPARDAWGRTLEFLRLEKPCPAQEERSRDRMDSSAPLQDGGRER